jgi:hypothetical protein
MNIDNMIRNIYEDLISGLPESNPSYYNPLLMDTLKSALFDFYQDKDIPPKTTIINEGPNAGNRVDDYGDGRHSVTYTNGDIEAQYPNGSSTYYDADRDRHIARNPDGSYESHYAVMDGVDPLPHER